MLLPLPCPAMFAGLAFAIRRPFGNGPHTGVAGLALTRRWLPRCHFDRPLAILNDSLALVFWVNGVPTVRRSPRGGRSPSKWSQTVSVRMPGRKNFGVPHRLAGSDRGAGAHQTQPEQDRDGYEPDSRAPGCNGLPGYKCPLDIHSDGLGGATRRALLSLPFWREVDVRVAEHTEHLRRILGLRRNLTLGAWFPTSTNGTVAASSPSSSDTR